MEQFVENIRQIGIFMIAAQAVVHLAPEKQYEKYIKLIAGIMVLMLFTAPFLDQSGEIMEKWQTQTEQIIREIDKQQWEGEGLSTEYGAAGSKQVLLNNVEEKIREQLNGLEICGEYEVTDVKLQLAEAENSPDETAWEIQKIHVGLQRISGREDTENEKKAGDGAVHVDQIVIDKVNTGEVFKDSNQNSGENEDGEASVSSFETIFGEALGISESCVEVEIYE